MIQTVRLLDLSGRGISASRRNAALEKIAECVVVEASVAENPTERSPLEFAVEWNGDLDLSVRVLQPYMASSLARDLPARATKRAHKLRSRYDGRARRHAEMGNVRRMTPASSERPCSRRPSM
jgi:hypothetical protein